MFLKIKNILLKNMGEVELFSFNFVFLISII